MAHFYGSLKGNRGTATRCGTKASGISASVQSWDGSVTVSLTFGSDGSPVLTIEGRDDSGTGGRTIWHGALRDFLEAGLDVSSE